MSICVSKNST